MAQSIDQRFNELTQKTGISFTGAAGANSSYVRGPSKPRPEKGLLPLIKSVGQSALNLPGQAISAVAGGAVKSFKDTAGGIVQNLPGLGSNQIAQHGFEGQRQQIDALGKVYKDAYKAGKISKEQYIKYNHKVMQDYENLSKGISNHLDTIVSPKDYLTGLASVGTLPLAAGRLTVAGSTPKALLGVETALQASKAAPGGALGRLARGAVKYPLITQPTATAPISLADNVQKGDVGAAAIDAATIAAPGIISGVGKVGKAIAPALREAAFGKSAVLTDALGSRVGGYLATNPHQAAVLKQMEQFTLNQPAVGGDVKKAGAFLAAHLRSIGVDPTTANIDDIVASFGKYEKNVRKLDSLKTAESTIFKAGTKGVVPANAVVSADFRKAIPQVVKGLKAVPNASAEEKARLAAKILDDAGVQNDTVKSQIVAALVNGAKPGELKAIVQKTIVPGVKLDKGYVATYGPAKRASIPTLEEARAAGLPEIGKKPSGLPGAIQAGAEKLGVGFKDFNPAQIGTARDTLINDVERILPGRDGKEVYDQLVALADDKKVTDLRQLGAFGKGELEQALDISPSEAKTLVSALRNMYRDVPISERGLAGKVQDFNLKHNPLARPYSRVQSALRYTLNPAFKAQQRIEAASIGQVVTGGMKPTGDVSKTIKLMRDSGFLPGVNKGFAGEAIGEVTGSTRISQKLLPSEEKSLARTLESFASKNGRSVEQELSDESTRKILRMIVQNPREGVLSSNFAKALNLALFPATYNIKVTALAAKALAKQPPAVQFGVVKSVLDFKRWSETDEGLKWQSDNSELLGLVGYFTPINSVQQTLGFLGDGDIRKLGLIGGLPFGVVSRVLEGQGAVPKSQPPYVDPKTGQVIPDQIPETTKARMQQGLLDIIDTMFTFPGRTAGLGSKKDLTNTLTGDSLKVTPGESKAVDRTSELKGLNLRRSEVLKKEAAPTSSRPAAYVPFSLSVPKPTIVPVPSKTKAKPKRGKTLAKRPGKL